MGKQTIRTASVMKKRHILKESIVATLLIMVMTFLISFIPLSMEYAKAFRQGFADFDIYDLYYSGVNKHKIIPNNNIILIELGFDRSEMADQVNLINTYSPKIIGLDATFEEPRDPAGDIKFSEAVRLKPNIVFAYGFEKNRQVPNIFFEEANHAAAGYVDFSDRPEFAVIRSYVPFFKSNGKNLDAFTSSIVRKVDPGKYEVLKQRNNDEELINYTGNFESYLNRSIGELNELDSVQLDRLIRNKIVLLGFFVKQDSTGSPPLVMDDLYYTPLNERISGKGFPDMYGVVVHANILSMILNENYATMASQMIAYCFAFLITLCLNYYFISRFHKHEHPGHGKLLLIQFLSILVALYFFLQFYNWFLFKVPIEPVMISMVLCLEILGLYKSVAILLHKKFKYQTVFAHKHII